MNIGILGLGGIANAMAKTINGMEGVNLAAVGSRNIEKAKDFAKKYNVPKYYGSYEELVKDNDIQLIYVATPHSHHYQYAKLCLENGKHVLCEKAFTANSKEAKEIISLAKEKNLLITEAIWTRYMPSRKIIDDVIKSNVIGKITSLTANLGYKIYQNERIRKPELAGGALLDITIYPINFMLMHLGKDIEKIEAVTSYADTGVDDINNITVFYKDKTVAMLSSNIYSSTDRRGMIYGENGYIEVTNINNPELIKVYNTDRELIETHHIPKQITGYEYEVLSSVKAIKEGKIECEEMPHSETIYVMEFMDKIRDMWNIKFPFEK